MVEIIAKSTHSEKRTRDFFKFHLFRVNPTRYVYLSIAIIVFIIALVFAFLKDYGKSLFFLFAALMVFVIRIVTSNMVVNRAIKNVIFPSKNYTLKFNQDEIIYATDVQKSKHKWTELLNVYEVDNYIFFYITKTQALILSKFVLNEEERKALNELIINSKVKFKRIKFK